MSATESRSGFRLPWSSDRSHESLPADAPAEPAAEDDPAAAAAVWPDSDFNARLGVTPTQPRPFEALPAEPAAPAADQDPDTATQEPVMLDTAPVAQPPVPTRKPTKLMADLSAAIRATAEAARDEAMAKVDADVAAVVAEIRAGSKEGEAALKQASDEDIVQIRDWSKAEIARIKEETEARIEARKALLGDEIAAHAAEIERRARSVEGVATTYRQDMAAYSERLAREDDPARLATMAESMPEPPALVDVEPVAEVEPVLEAEPVTDLEPVLDAEPVADLETFAEDEVPFADVEARIAGLVGQPAAEAAVEGVGAEPTAEPTAEAAVTPETIDAEPAPVAEATAGSAWADQPQINGPLAGAAQDDPRVDAGLDAEIDALETGLPALEAAAADDAQAARPWGAATPWGHDDMFQPPAGSGDGVPRWAADDASEGFPESAEGGDPVDRGAIMAALEAAAEAVVAAEAAAESADQAEAAADVAETAAELVVARAGSGDESDPEAQAAFSARVDAGGFDTESFADRLASLMPGHEPAVDDGAVRTTQVIVSGLVSVASIASFKRHLGRLGGVDGVAVASGPEGEFVFNVTHRADVSFRDALPTMPGFAARVTSIGDGVITVTARDPEAES